MNNVKILSLSYGNYVSLDDYVKLEQTLNKIKQIVIELKDDSESFDYDIVKEHKETILQIIDKVGDAYDN